MKPGDLVSVPEGACAWMTRHPGVVYHSIFEREDNPEIHLLRSGSLCIILSTVTAPMFMGSPIEVETARNVDTTFALVCADNRIGWVYAQDLEVVKRKRRSLVSR